MEAEADPDLGALFAPAATADAEIDLRGLALRPALARLAEGIRQAGLDGAASAVVRLDPASPTSGETLFQPIGRALIQARRRGHVAQLRPLAADQGAGWWIALPDPRR